jgi:hypothetical protein
MVAVAALGDARKMMLRWAGLRRKVERTGSADGLAREDFSKERRQAATWFGPKMKKEEMGCEIFFSNLIKGFEFKTKGLNFFKSILNWTQNRIESNRVLGILQNRKSGIWFKYSNLNQGL